MRRRVDGERPSDRRSPDLTSCGSIPPFCISSERPSRDPMDAGRQHARRKQMGDIEGHDQCRYIYLNIAMMSKTPPLSEKGRGSGAVDNRWVRDRCRFVLFWADQRGSCRLAATIRDRASSTGSKSDAATAGSDGFRELCVLIFIAATAP